MRKHIISASLLLLLAACQMQEEYVPVESGSGFTGETEEFAGETRTSLNESNSVVWSENDLIAVFQGCSVADKFEVSAASAGKTTGSFKEVTSEGDGGFESGNEIPDNVAVYPYMEDLECANGMFAEEDAYVYKIKNVYYPRIQVYQANSFPDDAFVMVAVTSGVKDNKLRFRNASGALRLRIKGDATVKSISIEGNADEPLGGYAVLKAYRDGSAPELESFGTSYGTVTLDCGNGVRLDEDTATEFIIALPPTDFENGFTVTIHPKDGEPDVRMTEKRNSVRRSRILNMPEIVFGVPEGPSTGDAVDLNADGQTANSYIISEAGAYRFAAVKGNSSEPVGDVASVEVLWESFGTSVKPSVGDLVKEVSYSDGYILFSTADNFRKGNAVIAAKDASGTILWSWHIWLTDAPEEQVYYNNAGTMMDRNLGATSAEPGDVGALGLLYQWGRKDPFLGSSDISNNTIAESTGSWPSAVSSSSSRGTVEYAVKNPMTFITATSSSDYDWHYSSRNNRLWQSEKTIYDPCPVGWRVPDGESNGVWSKALGSASTYNDTYDDSREGINFSGKFGSASTIWYPASGCRSLTDGSLSDVGNYGYYWSVTLDSNYAYRLNFNSNGYVGPSSGSFRAIGQSIRCFKEDSTTPPTETPKEYENLSAEGTANSYIVSQTGNYKFEAVKGNSYESVGSVSEVEVLWESFGTDVTPSVGDLIKEVSYSDGYILFSTADDFRKGNAVIAAKDASGTILWSWHIWLTGEPEGQVYYNNAGTMMDRNLGATSAEPGEVGALGLLYQWGRKDPFLGSSAIFGSLIAQSTSFWPSAVSSSSSRGTVEYAVMNPMTFITATSSSNYDWHYSSRNNKLWQSEKTIYDPCPAGWRVPDGGAYGVWSKALGSSSSYYDTYDDSREGINFSGRFGNASPIWYPASGYRYYNGGSLSNVGGYGFYWSVTPDSYYAYSLSFDYDGSVNPSNNLNLRAYGQSVRCLKEGSSTPPTETPKEYENLSAEGTANSYIVSQTGDYKFEAVKGNSSESVGDVASVEVLWESFGTSVKPSVGDLVKEVSYSDGYILFSTADNFREGNAVIAAKDASGTILWSWHIWLTDAPEEQVYYNNAGTMMDRNLGATSAEPGEVGALGLLYQWGRKDPFLGSSNISSNTVAKYTGSWPSAVSSSSSRGTVEYAVKNPMTFITATSSSDYDWHYSSRNNRLWQSEKTIYDPCPAGWRVPDGGAYRVWSKALGSSSSYSDTYDDSREGINFSGNFGSAFTIWYPASGYRSSYGGSLGSVGYGGVYWSCTPYSYYACVLYFDSYGSVNPSLSGKRASGRSVRCLKEGSSTPPTETPKEYVNLSAEGTANSYIVSQTGDYKFEAVKGNSSEPVGDVAAVEVLWESFGTDVTPSVGDLVKEVSYSDVYILFSTADNFRKGNAVIAAKDASGTILWSWHIWLTDEPEGQVYYNNAGTMMDRNLGATSATPGDVGALGLLYQWGRKDPFLGSSNISNDAVAKSTGSWPSAVSSSSSRGTVEYAVKNPMTFITRNSSNYDWYYTGSSSTDNTRWQSEKTIHDPCPAGWRVPDSGSNGVWSKALGSSSSYKDTYDNNKEGINFSGKFGNASIIWYPGSGYRSYDDGSLYNVGFTVNYWSVTPYSSYGAYDLYIGNDGGVHTSSGNYRANGLSVRCLQE